MFIRIEKYSIQTEKITFIEKRPQGLKVHFTSGETINIQKGEVELFWKKIIAAENNLSMKIE
jgi:hypothetical protein